MMSENRAVRKLDSHTMFEHEIKKQTNKLEKELDENKYVNFKSSLSRQLQPKIVRNMRVKARRRKRMEEIVAHRRNDIFDNHNFKAHLGKNPIKGERHDFSEVPGLRKMDQYRLTAERLKQLDSVGSKSKNLGG